jgi:hypothetical protein
MVGDETSLGSAGRWLALVLSPFVVACMAEPSPPYVPPATLASGGQGAASSSGGAGAVSGAGGAAGSSAPGAECRTERQCQYDDDCQGGTRCTNNRCVQLQCLPNGTLCDQNDAVCQSGLCGHDFTGGEPCTLFASSYCLQRLRPLGAECCPGRPNSCAEPNVCRRSPGCEYVFVGACAPRVGLGEACCVSSDCDVGLSCNGAGLCESLPQPILRATPAALEFSFVYLGAAPAPQNITVHNLGAAGVEFRFAGAVQAGLLDAVPEVGVIPQGGPPVEVTLSFAGTRNWTPGIYEDVVTIYGENAYPMVVPVTFRVASQ